MGTSKVGEGTQASTCDFRSWSKKKLSEGGNAYVQDLIYGELWKLHGTIVVTPIWLQNPAQGCGTGYRASVHLPRRSSASREAFHVYTTDLAADQQDHLQSWTEGVASES